MQLRRTLPPMWGQSLTIALSLCLSLSLCFSLSITHNEQVAPPAADGRAARELAESEQRVREKPKRTSSWRCRSSRRRRRSGGGSGAGGGAAAGAGGGGAREADGGGGAECCFDARSQSSGDEWGTNLLCRPAPAETASASGCQRDARLFLNAPYLGGPIVINYVQINFNPSAYQ